MRNWIKIIIAVAVNVALLAGCGEKREKTMTVVASFEPQAWMLRRIVGDSIKVITLLSPGTDAENYQPSPSMLRGMADADIWFTLGTEGFESTMHSSSESNFPDLEIFDVTSGIDKIYGTHVGEASFDPHLLASVRNSIIIAQNMTAKLCNLYPENASVFRNNAAELEKSLNEADERITAMGLEGKKFAIRHPSLSYFARDYGLVQLPLEMEGKEATPMQLMQRIEEIRRQNPQVIVIDAKHATERDREMADELRLLPMVVTLDDDDWLSGLKRIAFRLNEEGAH